MREIWRRTKNFEAGAEIFKFELIGDTVDSICGDKVIVVCCVITRWGVRGRGRLNAKRIRIRQN